MAGAVRPAVAGDLAAQAHVAEGVLERALERAGELRHRPFGRVRGVRLRNHGRTLIAPGTTSAKRRRFALLKDLRRASKAGRESGTGQ